jgi:hypothetical protein
MFKTVSTLVLIVLLSGYGGTGKAQECQVRVEPPAWKTNAVEKERERREFWQGLAFFGCAGSVIFLIVGVAMGSATIRKQRGGPRVFKP